MLEFGQSLSEVIGEEFDFVSFDPRGKFRPLIAYLVKPQDTFNYQVSVIQLQQSRSSHPIPTEHSGISPLILKQSTLQHLSLTFRNCGLGHKSLASWRKIVTMESCLSLRQTMLRGTWLTLWRRTGKQNFSFGVSRKFGACIDALLSPTFAYRYGSVIGATFATLFPVNHFLLIFT